MRIDLSHSVAALAFVLLGLARCLHAAEDEGKRFFRADPPGAVDYTLPDPLTAADGRKIATADEWKSIRRPEILELFRKHVYGRVPATPYEKSFKVVQRGPRRRWTARRRSSRSTSRSRPAGSR